MVPPQRLTYQQELKEMGKRNVNVKKSYELERQGLVPNPYLFEAEAELMKHAKMSKANWNNLYNQFLDKSRRLDKPAQMADTYVLARVYKFVLFKTGKEEVSQDLEKDYFMFQGMYQQRLDSQKMLDIESLCHQHQRFKLLYCQLFAHKDQIMKSEQQPDILEQNGFKYNDSVFDDLYVKSFQETIEEETFEEEKKGGGASEVQPQKKAVITKDDFLVDSTEDSRLNQSQRVNQKQVDRDLFNLDEDSKSSSQIQSSYVEEEEEEEPEIYQSKIMFIICNYEQTYIFLHQIFDEIDIDSLDPDKVNWFKYITDKYLSLKDEDGNESALQNADAYVNLLNIFKQIDYI